MATLIVPLCSRCGIRPRMIDGKSRPKARCAECYGKCMTCENPAGLTVNDYPRKHCGACRYKYEKKTDTCSKCGQSRDGTHGSYCRACERQRDRDRRQKDHAKFALKDRKQMLRRFYGMTLEDYEVLLGSQGGGCGGCGATRSTLKISANQSDRGARGGLHVDHCHTTGKVRGILCASCNAALGRVKDNPATLRALAGYLERHQ